MPGTYQYDVEIKSNVAKLLSDMKQVQDRLDTVEGKEYKIKLNVDEKKLSSVISNLEKMLDSLGKGTGDFKQFENLSKELSSIVSEVQSLSKAFGKVDDSGTKTLLSSIQNIDKSLSELSQNILNVNKNMSNMSGNTSGAVKQVENISNAYQDAAKEAEKLADAQSKIGQKTNISSGSNPAIEQQNKLQEELKETQQQAEKARQSISELVKGRDVVSQNWYREKGTVIGKDSKGNDITRDADEFSFVERLKNGQLQTVLATYNEETGKWAEQVINVRTAFEQVEKAIISADNKIASLEMTRDKTLAAHSGYDATADQNQIDIEKAKRDELQQTLNLYGQEKEYVFEIEAANKRIADNQERLNNKKQSQTNLRQAVSDEQFLKDWDAAIAENNKRDTESTKQAKKELNDAWNEAVKVNTALDETKATLSSLSKMPELTSNFSDMESKVSSLNSDLTSGKITLSEYKNEVKFLTSEYSKMVNIQQNRNVEEYTANAEAAKKEVAELQAIAEAKKKARQTERESVQTSVDNALKDQLTAWKNIQSIREKINNTSDTHEIEVLKQVKSEYQQNYIEADKILKANSDLYDKETQLAKLEQIRIEANNKIASSQEKQISSYENKLSSYQTKKAGYDATIARFNDGGWTSDEYLKNVQAVKDAVKKYEDLLSDIKAKGGIASEEDVQKLKEYEGEIKKTISTVTNMSASEKGYNFVSGQKELDKIHKLLNENSKMSSEAKNKIRAYYAEVESGNPSMSLDKIHAEIMKIYNAEVEAGRAGKSMWSIIKSSGFHQIAAQMAGIFSVYDVINGLKQVASTVRELDTAYTEMRKVSNESAQSLKNFQKESFSTADSVGTTALALQDATATWMRLGESLDQAKESAKDATVLLNVSEFDNINEATDSLVAMSQAYKELDKMEIIDVLDKIGNEYSISTDQLSTALKDSAAVLKTQGNDLAESVALITAGNTITQDASKTAGETLPERYRNIFYRTYLTARAA